MKKEITSTISYVLSVIGLLCCCFGGLGFLLSVPAYIIADSNIKKLQTNPEEYEGNVSGMNTAKIVALVILIINLLHLLYTIYFLTTGGWEEIMEQIREAMEEAERNRS